MEGISIIIPAYNEQDSIREVIDRIRHALGDRLYEIFVIDDGSTDDTRLRAQDVGVHVISNPVNVGYGFSLKRGFAAAQYECVVITDADGTYPVEEIPALIGAYDNGFDMVVGARQGKAYWSSVTKTIARFCFKWMSEFVVGRRIPDINSGFRVIRKSKILPLLPDVSNAFSFTTSVTLVFFLKHFFIRYIPISYHERKGASKVRYFRDALVTLQIMVEIIVKYNPIKLFLLVAILPTLIAIAFLAAAFFTFSLSLASLSLVSFFVAIIVMSCGFIATIFRKA